MSVPLPWADTRCPRVPHQPDECPVGGPGHDPRASAPPRVSRLCAERFGEEGGYDPACCRFPKSCSPTVHLEAIAAGTVTEADLVPLPEDRPARLPAPAHGLLAFITGRGPLEEPTQRDYALQPGAAAPRVPLSAPPLFPNPSLPCATCGSETPGWHGPGCPGTVTTRPSPAPAASGSIHPHDAGAVCTPRCFLPAPPANPEEPPVAARTRLSLSAVVDGGDLGAVVAISGSLGRTLVELLRVQAGSLTLSVDTYDDEEDGEVETADGETHAGEVPAEAAILTVRPDSLIQIGEGGPIFRAGPFEESSDGGSLRVYRA